MNTNKILLEQVAKEHDVSAFGFGVGDGEAIDLQHFEAALEFCRDIGPSKQINRGNTSYGLKHVCETICGFYITNGAFIAAAIAVGHRYVRDGANAWFYMNKADLQKKFDQCDAMRKQYYK